MGALPLKTLQSTTHSLPAAFCTISLVSGYTSSILAAHSKFSEVSGVKGGVLKGFLIFFQSVGFDCVSRREEEGREEGKGREERMESKWFETGEIVFIHPWRKEKETHS